MEGRRRTRWQGRNQGNELGISNMRRCFLVPIMTLRIYIHRNRWLLRFTQVVRGWWILGPLRPYAVRYYRWRTHDQPVMTQSGSFPHVDVEQIVDAIDQQGYAKAGQISEAYVAEIIELL